MGFRWKHLWVLAALLALPPAGAPALGGELPPWLPRYDLDIQLQIDQHVAVVHERATWTNRHQRPARELVFNAHSHYKIPDNDVGLLAKSLEIMRLNPGEVLDFEGPACRVDKVSLLGPPGAVTPAGYHPQDPAPPAGDGQLPLPRPLPAAITDLPFHFDQDNQSALVVPLPRTIAQGESVTVEIEFTMHLPEKQGRWGHWKGVTFLSNWQPVLAFYDDHGWQPTPFVPWHQPFFNESGIYRVRVTLPCDQKVACSGSVVASRDLGNGLRQLDIEAPGFRDFAFLCSARYQVFEGQAGPVHVRCLAFPEHEHYAREMVRIACEAIPAYSRWFGPYPYPEFTVVESYFGWNGNECAGLVMIDERVFSMPHLADHYVDYLLSHETCHQWWYNTVGTNGYAETWMDEALATYFARHLMRLKYGKNDPLLRYPRGLEWLPNIYREDYNYAELYGTIGRGEAMPTVQEYPKYGHVINLFSMCYDRGSKVLGMIVERLGEDRFYDFMRGIYCRYQFRIIRVADFQRELEAYTGESWDPFFKDWLYGAGMTDWCVEKVTIERSPLALVPAPAGHGPHGRNQGPWKVTVLLHQKAEINEQTVLGFCLDGGDGFQVRVPIVPDSMPLDTEDPPAHVEMLADNHVRVEVELPCKPTQIAVDPDQVLVDRDPSNNYWKPRVRWRLTPLYTQLEETDLTNAYDRWNFIAGPWIYGASYDDPWFTRSARVGVRAGIYRTQEFEAGAYLAYRPDEGDVVAGVDGLRDHWPWPHTQVGFTVERGLSRDMDDENASRGVLFGRYVFQYSSSLYLPPMNYLEVFGAVLDHDLPEPDLMPPGANHFNQQTLAGVHYHLDYLTPYWDPAGGFRFDTTYATGVPIFGERRPLNRVDGQFSIVKSLPDGLGYLSETRLAARVYGAAGLPKDGEFFPLGGSELFRGFDIDEYQGNLVWVASLEWRLPLLQGLTWDCLDHCVGLRNVYGAVFYDAGDVYLNGHELGPVFHAVGGGLRLDVTWFSFVERSIIRLDVAKAVNANTPTQVWFSVGVPF